MYTADTLLPINLDPTIRCGLLFMTHHQSENGGVHEIHKVGVKAGELFKV